MEASKIDTLMVSLVENLRPEQSMQIREMLQNVSDDKYQALQLFPYKKPMIALILSLFLGGLGVDRMYTGKVGLGILKLITCGGLGIWTIVDWFVIMDAVKNKNYEDLITILL